MFIIENGVVYEGLNCQNQDIALMVLKKKVLEKMLVFLEGDNRIQITPHGIRTVQKYCMNLLKSYIELKCSWISPHSVLPVTIWYFQMEIQLP